MNIFSNGDVKIIDRIGNHSVIKNGKVGSGGGCIRNMGILQVEGVTIKDCLVDDELTLGGAIEAWNISAKIKLTDAETYILDTIIENCKAGEGGGIGTSTSKLAVSNDSLGSSTSSKKYTTSSSGNWDDIISDDEKEICDYASIQIENTIIRNCKAKSDGAIAVEGVVVLENCEIDGCKCDYKGAGSGLKKIQVFI